MQIDKGRHGRLRTHLVPSPELQRVLAVLRRDEVVMANQTQAVAGARAALVGRQMCPGSQVPARNSEGTRPSALLQAEAFCLWPLS